MTSAARLVLTTLPQPTTLKAPFLEQFTDDWDSRWKVSHAKKEGTEEDWAFVGKWSVEEPTVLRGIEGDKGLVLKDKAAHHAISAKFPEAIDNKDNTLVVQYEVKMQCMDPLGLGLYDTTLTVHSWPGVRRCLHEASPGERSSSR